MNKNPDNSGLSEEEKSAIKERIEEIKRNKVGEDVILAKISKMPKQDRELAMQIHRIIKENAPFLTPRLWYGMPAYSKEGKVVCFFQGSYMFKARYATLGFTDEAKLDKNNIWPVAFAVKKITKKEEKIIKDLIKKAIR